VERKLLTPDEVAQALGVGRTKIYDLMRTGVLQRVKIGRCTRIPATSVDAFIDVAADTAPLAEAV
jgi:excisionase family DNA binding protein